jgi:ubiquinone/menaquinone biosynthesis C-methylase UbiE
MCGEGSYRHHRDMDTAAANVDPDAFDAFEAAGWEERAGGYHRSLGAITSRVIEPLLDAAEVDRGMRVLDMATGPGYVAAAAAIRGAQVVGVDGAGEMVALARRLRPQLEFFQANAQELPFADDTFDAVVANFLILHVGRPEQAAAELARVLAPGGILSLTTWDVPERARLLGVLFDAVQVAGASPPADVPAGPPIFRFADDAEFARLLVGAGLEQAQVRTISFTYSFKNADTLWNGLLDGTVRMGAVVRGQSKAIQARIRVVYDTLVREYAVDGRLELPVSVKLASGRKPGD